MALKDIEPYQFKPGQSGNPSGRPRKPLTERLIAKLAQEEGLEAAALVAAILKKAKEGDISAWREIADRIEGKPVQQVEHSGPDSGPITSNIVVRFVDGE